MYTDKIEDYISPSMELLYLEMDCPVVTSNLESPEEGDIIEW